MRPVIFIFSFLFLGANASGQGLLVLQTDFGLKDGAVSAMKGVATSVSREIGIYDLTHEIPAYNIWEASYRLHQASGYWPVGTVFVSVVDPGVGSSRRSIVAKSKSGHYFVTPDNGTLTLIAESPGVAEVRIIDEKKNRLPGSESSYTFHGRDVYAYTGARLAAGVIRFEDVGPLYRENLVNISYQKAALTNELIAGTIDILDVQYGNLWTNVDQKLIGKINLKPGDNVKVAIFEGQVLRYEGIVKFGNTFADVAEGEPIAYLNSLMNFSLAINMGNFAEKNKISSGPEWRITIAKTP